MMPRPPTLRIAEVFASIQGEGLRQGEPTLFIRTSGCDLRCRFCDTRYAWKGGASLSLDDIMARLLGLRERFPAEWVCLTGGEPLLQDVSALARALKNAGLKIHVETNGRRYRRLPVDWYTVSPKPDAFRVRKEYQRLAGEVKLVVTRGVTLETVGRLRRDFPRRVPILLQPQSLQRGSAARALKILAASLRAGLPNIRLSVQAHKILGLP